MFLRSAAASSRVVLVALGAAALSACGGGASRALTALPAASAAPAGATPAPVVQPASGAHLTLTFTRTAGQKKRASSHARSARGTRAPRYISADAEGVQISVVAPDETTHTVYADISAPTQTSAGSPLCTVPVQQFAHTRRAQNEAPTTTETCTIPLPLLAPNDRITATELDERPGGEAASGLGTGFDSGGSILAGGSTTVTSAPVAGGVTIVPLALGPVAGPEAFYDCGPTTASASVNASDIGSGNSAGGDEQVRIVVTGGVPSTIQVQPQTADADGNFFQGVAGQPFADVNASPAPITATSNAADVTVASVTNPSISTTAASAYGMTATFADSVTQSNINQNSADGCFTMILDVHYDGTSTTPSTIALNNNDNAVNPLFDTGSYADTLTYTVVPITASVSVPLISAGVTTATATGIDPGANNPMTASACTDSAGNTLATLSDNGDYNATTGMQTFTVTGQSPGTCTFVLMDGDSPSQFYAPAVQTMPVQLIVTGSVILNAAHAHRR